MFRFAPCLKYCGIAIVALALAAGINGCNSKEETAASGGAGTAGKKKVVLGYVAKSLSNQVFTVGFKGAQQAAKDLGTKYGVEVEVRNLSPENESAQKQAEAILTLTRDGVQGIMMSATQADTVKPAIDKAVDAGIPVMCFDSDVPESKRLAYYGSPDYKGAVTLMELLAKSMGEKGTVAVLAGNQSAPNLRERVRGVEETIKKYPNMKLATPNGVFYHVETPDKAAEAINTAQIANPDIQGWALIGGWPLFTKDALKWPAGSIKVVSWDGLPQQLGYLRDGHVDVLLAQDCFGWGYKSTEVLLDKIINSKDPSDKIIFDPLNQLTKQNADEQEAKFKEWLK